VEGKRKRKKKREKGKKGKRERANPCKKSPATKNSDPA